MNHGSEPEARPAALADRSADPRGVLAHAPIMLFALDRDGVITMTEGRGLAALGLTAGRDVGRSVLEIHRDRPAALAILQRALAGESFRTEFEFQGFRFDSFWECVRDPEGRIAGVVGVLFEAAARAPDERPAAESELRFRQIADHIQEVFWLYDPAADRVLYASPVFESLFGRSRQGLYAVSRTLLDAVHPDDREAREQVTVRHLRGETTDTEYRIVRPDGTTRWVRERGFPVRGPGGATMRVAGLIEDITPRRAAEDQLRHTVSRLEATLESTADGILVLDEAWRVTAFNTRCAELWGIAPEVLARGSFELLREVALGLVEDPQVTIEGALRIVLDPGLAWSERVTFRDGRVIECYSLPQRIGGACVGRVFSFRDVTERLRAEERLRAHDEELRHAQKMDALGRLAGGVAHDFNNLLTAILGHAQLLLESLPEGDPRASALEIQAASQRAAALTRQLLSLGRKQATRLAAFDLQGLLDDSLPMLRAVLGEGVSLVCEGVPGWVLVDRGEAEQLLMNLTVNARDAMAGHGTLRIACEPVTLMATDESRAGRLEAGEYVRLRVGDTGCGMDGLVRARAFEPFFTTKSRGQGLGLGLAMAYATMTRCGGSIEVESEPGAGATFTLMFPRVEAGADVHRAEEPLARPLGGREHVLVVEDEEVVRALVMRMLSGLGYRVSGAASADEALASLADAVAGPDLLVTDLVMPGRSGLGLAQALRARWPALPVVCISGYADDDTTRRMLSLPDVAFLPKPFAPDALARLIRARLDAAPRREA
jgi:two-component system, cell cycle sensor histidine kinase and response regulator CckA